MQTDLSKNAVPRDAQPIFSVGSVPVYGDAILAPMMGFSDWPFRSLCRDLGSAISYSEFSRAEGIVNNFHRFREKLFYTQDERPVALQLYSDNPNQLLEAALRVRELHPDFIDINMGCPTRSVANGGAGVGLMRTPLKVARIFKKLSAALDLPVTGKIRLGWNDCKNYKLIARIVEENGGALIAVHGRTREEGREGEADWDAIAEICQAVSIPVIGNGNVETVSDVQRMKEYTGCQAVMIGRAAIGNPWIFAGINRENVSKEQVRQMVTEHLKRNQEFYGPEDGLKLFRKHAARYIAPYRTTRKFRRELLSRESVGEFLALLETIQVDRMNV